MRDGKVQLIVCPERSWVLISISLLNPFLETSKLDKMIPEVPSNMEFDESMISAGEASPKELPALLPLWFFPSILPISLPFNKQMS